MSDSVVAKSSIYEKIEQKGYADAQEIYRVGQEQAKQLEASMLQDAQTEIDKILSKAKDANENRIKTKTTEFEQNAKQQILLNKKELIDESFNQALQELKKLPDQELITLVSKLIQLEPLQGDEILKVSKNDFSRYLKLFSSGKMQNGFYLLDKLSALLDNNYHLLLANQPVDIDGGFILIGKDFDIDLSYKSILNDMKEKNEIAIASMLFDDEE